MEVVFSTLQVHPRDRFDYWHSVACSNIADHASVAECRHSFEASLQCGNIGDIGLVKFENSAMAISHTQYHADRSASDDLLVCRQDAGSLAVQQAGRELTLEAGTITLIDPRLPYEGKFSSGSRLLVFKIPRRLLEVRLGNARNIAALPLKSLDGKNSLISTFLAMLPAHTGRLEHHHGKHHPKSGARSPGQFICFRIGQIEPTHLVNAFTYLFQGTGGNRKTSRRSVPRMQKEWRKRRG